MEEDRRRATDHFKALVEEVRGRIRSDDVRLEDVECPSRVPERGFSLRSEGREVTVCFYREGDNSQPHLVGSFLLIHVGVPGAVVPSDYGALHYWRETEMWTTDLALLGFDIFKTLPSEPEPHESFTNAQLAEQLIDMLTAAE